MEKQFVMRQLNCNLFCAPGNNIVGVQFQEEIGHFIHPRMAIGVDPPFESGRPGIIHKAAVFQVVVRMMVGNKNGAQGFERNISEGRLAAGPIAAVHHVRNFVDQHHPGGLGSHLVGPRAPAVS